ncbi:MAG: hypothetical protein QNJ32_15995 [Xenococcaceae cyanobacterium MO_167.B27]|nr:hypothetical protein [Xenococcaceae cyanobacterium MO_167.B27]
MASSEEFKQAIREGRLNDALVLAITKAPELKITTWIASASDSNPQAKAGNCLHTDVNLVEGEITNQIGAELIGDRLYQKAQQFHNQQVSQGHQTISQNLEGLQKILGLMAILQQQKQGENYQPLKPFKVAAKSLPEASISEETQKAASVKTDEPKIDETTPITEIPDAESPEDNILSFKDLESPAQTNTQEANRKDDDNDWGEWLEEEEDNLEADILTLDAFDLDESEEWGDETEFLPNSGGNPIQQDKNAPKDKP